ncbi:MAG: hypothetical protein KKE44_06150 [Proteobacteria bacterium]|nr:hypothetical protein [Pseudomonadota bacterium]MBU1582310.1 hypothetical protein [Pseudomonadota bacterium]MBU2453092.1 hypothetical protein [Pseudomonadota bacterium]MBU2631752.1 hypothetical protein [Pseudomonadota bacterium]
MAIFGNLFGTRKQYPPLEPTDPLAQHLNGIRQPLENFANQVKDSLEVVPADKTTYIFVGKPPKQFGIVWVQNGEIHNLKSLADQKGLSAVKLAKTSEELANAYRRSEKDSRYSAKIGDCSLVVAASKTLSQDVDRIIQTVSS